MVERYVPTIGSADWNIKEMDSEQRARLKNRLVLALVTSEEEYQAVIGYLYRKYPYEMDLSKLPNGTKNVPIQWNYSVAKNKLAVHNKMLSKNQDMYAFIVYDKERDMEPVAFAGSYFKLGTAQHADDNEKYLCDINGKSDPSGRYQRFGIGYVMFVDPDYRRLGLATDLWWAEAQLYREALGIRFQKEIQNEYSLVSTQKMFSDPSKCIVTSPGRLKNDGTRCQIRCLLDYEDSDLIDGFNSMLPGLKTIYRSADWTFMKREGMSMEELTKYW